MNEDQNIVAEAQEFVFELFKRRLPPDLVYHTFSHSESVASAARKIAEDSDLGEEGIEIVVLAALFHDTGYTEIYKGHEEISIRIAKEFFQAKQYPENKIELIAGCIAATKVPQSPKNILEEIVADADLANLGKKSFFRNGELLRIEWERALVKHYTDDEWLEQNIHLLSTHAFFTRAAQLRYEERQSKNLRQLYAERKLSQADNEQSLAAGQSGGGMMDDDSEIMRSGFSGESERNDKRIQNDLRLFFNADKTSRFLFGIAMTMTVVLGFISYPHGATVFTRFPEVIFSMLFVASTICAVRAVTYRIHPRDLASFDEANGAVMIEHLIELKQHANQWAIGLFIAGVSVGLLIHIIVQLIN